MKTNRVLALCLRWFDSNFMTVVSSGTGDINIYRIEKSDLAPVNPLSFSLNSPICVSHHSKSFLSISFYV